MLETLWYMLPIAVKVFRMIVLRVRTFAVVRIRCNRSSSARADATRTSKT